MIQFLLKTFISAMLIAGSSQLSQRSTQTGASLVSLSLTSLLAIVWLWRGSNDPLRITTFASDILWPVLPSLLLFMVLPLMLRSGHGFWLSLGCGVLATVTTYTVVVAPCGGMA